MESPAERSSPHASPASPERLLGDSEEGCIMGSRARWSRGALVFALLMLSHDLAPLLKMKSNSLGIAASD